MYPHIHNEMNDLIIAILGQSADHSDLYDNMISLNQTILYSYWI